MGWRLLAATGMRRGEALALRWRDVDLDAGRLQVRRSVGMVKTKGAGEQLVEGPTKTGQARVVDIDAGHRRRPARLPGGPRLADARARPGRRARARQPRRHATGTPSGTPAASSTRSRQARKALGEDQLPRIRLHDLRHTHATLLLAAGEPVKVVSERLGHASATITLTVYQHVHPGMGRQAADRFAALLDGADQRREVSRRYHEALPGPDTTPPRAPDLQEHRGDAVSEGGLEPPRPIKGTSTSS